MIIGREKEIEDLKCAYSSEYSEFVAVTGRRRIGKTFLIREVFNYKFTFQHSGLANQKTRQQLKEFQQSLIKCGMKKCRVPQDWFDAFFLLSEFLDSQKKGKKVVFIDEMPWMDAPRSNFVSALEHFWNGYASARKDILLIICGSSTSWIINNIYKNHGGLHNRVTERINLQPFTLRECMQYVKSRGLVLSKRQIAEGYMIMGGVPFYWAQLQKGLSLDQNVDNLFFAPDGKLRYEYNELYNSLFKNPEPYIQIVNALGKKKIGMTREEILVETSLADNGKFKVYLDDLTACGFVSTYNTFGKPKNCLVFQLKDQYTLFYFKFLAKNEINDSNFWTHNIDTPLRNTWEGLAFEQLCFAHIAQIKQKLGISGIYSAVYSWQTKENGAQIDMLIDRADNVVNVCEIKFSRKDYAISEDVMENIFHKIERFSSVSKTSKAVHLTMITAMPLVKNEQWNDVQSVVTLDDLFK
ncbi:MAG: AAA family ATPase [Bacteroidales bacterium]|nr:AAA family ATPase [Bacteroidales bacterium]